MWPVSGGLIRLGVIINRGAPSDQVAGQIAHWRDCFFFCFAVEGSRNERATEVTNHEDHRFVQDLGGLSVMQCNHA